MDPGEGTDADTGSVTSFSTTSKVSSNESKPPGVDKVEKVSRELFDKATTYFQGELSSTCDTYALLEELNTLTIQQYESLSNSTHHIKDSLHDLDVKYTLLLPYLEQLNQLDVSVASLEQATLRLDAYTKVLESKFKKLEKR